MEKYSEYKDSGVKWLGEIPSHWTLLPGLAVMKENKEKNSNLEYNTILSLSYGKIIIKKDINEGLVPAEYNTYQIVKPGYIVIRCTDLQNDKTSLRTGLVKNEGIITSAYLGLVIDAQNNPSYIHYFLHAWDITKELYRHGSGLRQSLSWLDLKRLPILIPSRTEQDAIVSYLDTVTSKIDVAIEQQKKMIELLNERKQIIINNAVTKGLDPNVKMKDSGVDWIGGIPEGWEVKKLKHIAKTNSGSTPRSISGKDNPQSTIKWVRTTDLKNSHITDTSEYLSINEMKSASCPLLPKGTVLISMYGGEGSFGKLGLLDTEATINQALCSINCTDKIIPEFIFFYLQAIHPIWIKYAMSTRKDPNLNQQTIKNIDVVFPAIDEQMYIVSAINKSIIQIDRALDNFNDQISLLQERKQIIINEVVTGKVKVS